MSSSSLAGSHQPRGASSIGMEQLWELTQKTQIVETETAKIDVHDFTISPGGDAEARQENQPALSAGYSGEGEHRFRKGRRTVFRNEDEQQSERSDAGRMIVEEVFVLVRRKGTERNGPERSGGARAGI
jgi:hypothetical protein